jgi:hypothetical protein
MACRNAATLQQPTGQIPLEASAAIFIPIPQSWRRKPARNQGKSAAPGCPGRLP